MLKTRIIFGIILAVSLLLPACSGTAGQEEEAESAISEAGPALTDDEVKEESTAEEIETEETVVAESEAEESADERSGKDASKDADLPSASSEVIRLYYYGPSAMGVDPAGLPGAHNIYSATSDDGINFYEDPGVRFSHDTGSDFGITDADVVRLTDGSWLMFLSLGTQLLKATSPTSLGTFTLDDSFKWNRGGVPGSFNFNGTIRTFVCQDGTIHTATYNQESGVLNYEGVALASPASGFIADPSVIQIEDSYLMFYKYAYSPATPPDEHEIYLSTSTDGIEWTQHEQNRFICTGSVPGAVYYDDIIYVYYCGLKYTPGSLPSDLGVAISRDNGVTFTTSSAKIEGKKATGVVDPSVIVIDSSEER